MIAGETSRAYEEVFTINMVRQQFLFLTHSRSCDCHMTVHPHTHAYSHTDLMNTFSAGDLSCCWDWSVPATSWPACGPGGELSHYPDGGRGAEQSAREGGVLLQ